jgi:tetratricopeptide (TPR) repeat protein
MAPAPAGRRRLAAAVACVLLAAACGSGDRGTAASSIGPSVVNPPPGLGLQPLALPDSSRMESPAREQMQARLSSLRSSIEDGAAPARLADAYGEMGKLLMAATFLEPSEACYVNAQTLAPRDRRWPYYLGHLYRIKGPLQKSVASFERALELAQNDAATLVWLGEVHLAEGRAEAAGPLFAKALALQPSAAAWFGSGRVALAARNYAGAVKDLQQALSLDPLASSIHYPLALAYRGAGDLARAEAHLARQGDTDPRPVDPLMRELDELLQSPEAYNVRGGEALEVGDWALAAQYFRKGLEAAPGDPSLRHRLGTALFQMGDLRGAAEQFEQVVRTAPDHARSHFSLGMLMSMGGRHAEAIERFSTALKHDPGYEEARVQLAATLARSGRAHEALVEYDSVLTSNPAHVDAAFGRAMTLFRLDRYQDAHDRLSEGMRAHPGEPMFSHALARVLAAAPDDRVRDGRRALKLVDALIEAQQTIELAETTAMALAETGRYREAAAVQRDALAAARQAGLPQVERGILANLQRYERGEPCRMPFRADEMP